MSLDIASNLSPPVRQAGRVDAHQHFWRRDRGDYDWLDASDDALGPLLRDFMPADLAPALARHGIASTVLVQAAPTIDETRFLLDIAAHEPGVGAVVGWVDLAQAASVRTLERLSEHPSFRGVRPMLQDLSDPQWIATAPQACNLDALVSLGLRFDALVRPAHLGALGRFARARPALPVVIDHAGKPPLRLPLHSPQRTSWRADMANLAALPHVACKFSGLVTELPAAATTSPTAIAGALRPVLDDLLGWFGPARLMWGSDWPVLGLATAYDPWVEACELLFSGLSADERSTLWQGSARRFYALG